MRSKLVVTALALAGSLSLTAQDKKTQDKKAIKDMCGCYEVKFNFAETFNYANDSTYMPSADKHSGGIEWVELVEDSDNKIVMQHLLVVGPPQAKQVVKHWRQDWIYENTDLYTYDHGNKWTYTSLTPEAVKGQWTQKVFQVDDSPRYEGTASWVHVDGKSYWESKADAPLPRREFSIRKDYNVTSRLNRHEITPNGWVHEQDNQKVIRKADAEDQVLAEEKGYNTYTKVDSSKCKAAIDYWAAHAEKWAKVRSKWETVFAKKQDLLLRKSLDDKPLFHYLLDNEAYSDKESIDEVIDTFIGK
ncbi:DUF6607 family protein [Robertkochia sediminum]|uniref:DUF6607 family protein n=1 Tax=Robertkochia sediminum TaxID=2785326 RepID=UPI0019340EC3|nr:DUF6607 family protein [Robertkochia sediminum]MBL7471440.1 hypothetical protein [Robertkochia sediminum]